jgi:MoxR-like ATPase
MENTAILNTVRMINSIRNEIKKVIVGQEYLIDRLLITLLCNEHLLIEGVPGLAKTRSVRALSQVIDSDFNRIQFTPDLLPADITGTLIFNQKEGNFSVKKGPVFTNILLADEINRSPAKVQSALLEAMQERQVTIGETTFQIAEPFMVMATQNPIEQDGTYPLPEAQIDRFMLKAKISYPDHGEELNIVKMVLGERSDFTLSKKVTSSEINECRASVNDVFLDEKVLHYIVDIVQASREPKKYKLDLVNYIQYGASPRAAINLAKSSKALALLKGRDWVSPEDVQEIGFDVLRHRIIPSYEAEAEDISSEEIISKIFETLPMP